MFIPYGQFEWVFKAAPAIREDVEAALHEAASQKRKIILRYDKLDGTPGIYYVSPYSFRQHKRGTFFYGYDFDDGTIKSFFLPRIRHVVITSTKFRATQARPWKVEL